MAEAEIDQTIKRFLSELIQREIVGPDAFAAVCEEKGENPHDPIEIIVVDQGLYTDLIAESIAMNVVAWDVDPRIDPFPCTPQQWTDSAASSKLHRAGRNGRIIRA